LSLLKGKPCPQDVLCGIRVCVGLVAACETSERRLTDAVPRRYVPALGAPLRGVTGIDCDHLPSSAFSLGGQDPQKNTPSRIVD
jgi:hypothetical protein